MEVWDPPTPLPLKVGGIRGMSSRVLARCALKGAAAERLAR